MTFIFSFHSILNSVCYVRKEKILKFAYFTKKIFFNPASQRKKIIQVYELFCILTLKWDTCFCIYCLQYNIYYNTRKLHYQPCIPASTLFYILYKGMSHLILYSLSTAQENCIFLYLLSCMVKYLLKYKKSAFSCIYYLVW